MIEHVFASDETDYARLRHEHYRTWTAFAFRDPAVGLFGVKLGPITVFTYLGLESRRVLSWTWRCGGEHRVI